MANICWNCKKAYGKCSWAKNYTPVPGWTATPVIRQYGKETDTSYDITKCPQFEKER